MDSKPSDHHSNHHPPKHEHTKPKVDSIEWFFHHPDHDQITHCEGSKANHYTIKHAGSKHVIDKEYARGHGISKEPQWFKFTKKIGSGWDLASGTEVEVSGVMSGHIKSVKAESMTKALKG